MEEDEYLRLINDVYMANYDDMIEERDMISGINGIVNVSVMKEEELEGIALSYSVFIIGKFILKHYKAGYFIMRASLDEDDKVVYSNIDIDKDNRFRFILSSCYAGPNGEFNHKKMIVDCIKQLQILNRFEAFI